jgi:HAD superfamily hydrolase (TIGR01450 family)
MPDATPSPVLSRFAPLASAYDVVLCDVWGVLHDGLAAHAAAGDALTRFRATGGAVVLVSNAPRASDWVIEHLDGYGVPRSAWDAVVTSGDVTRHMLAERGVTEVHHIGPERDLPLFGDPGIGLVGVDEASIVVITGLVDEQTETPDDYRDRLAALKARGLPMICANPDIVVGIGDQLLWCAGSLAEIYVELGGETHFAGKPYAPVYDAALGIASDILKRNFDRSRVIAIGDAVRTDLAGATAAGIDCLFVADGIHGDELGRGDPSPEKLAALFAEHGYAPVAVTNRLEW